MMFLVAIVTGLLIWGIGRLLVRFLGWPTNLSAAGRWCVALLVISLLLSGTRDGVGRLARAAGELPTVPLDDVVPVLALVGLAFLGYVSWTRGEALREARRDSDERARALPRNRAAPPPPHGEDGGFVPFGGNDE